MLRQMFKVGLVCETTLDTDSLNQFSPRCRAFVSDSGALVIKFSSKVDDGIANVESLTFTPRETQLIRAVLGKA